MERVISMSCRLSLVFLISALYVRVIFAEDRVALVIGNAKYEGDAALRNPVNDADAIAAALTKLDFKVAKKTDLNLAQFEDAVVSFRRSLTKDSVGLFFYAGHGVQVKGENFLVPLEAKLREEFEVKPKCYGVDNILAAMDESEAALKIVILDSCRDNPFTRSWTRSASGKGLASIGDIPNGTILAFSTAPGKTALDSAAGARGNSPYTTQLVASLQSRPDEGLEVKAALFAASRAVKQQTGQVPWLNLDASLDEYYLWRNGATSTPKPMPIPPPTPKPTPAEPLPPRDPASNEKSFTNSIGMKMVLIPAGHFTMGSAENEEGHFADQKTVAVTLTKSFYLGQTEVTQGQWKSVVGTAPWKGSMEKEGANYPAMSVSWEEATEFCKKLSSKEGKPYRLPTEAEWEYSCRGGSTTAFSFGGDATRLGDYGWWGGISKLGNAQNEQYAHQVGQKKPNPFGLFDMHGNAWEWCHDVYVNQLPGGTDPVNTSKRSERVYRGGSWRDGTKYCRSAHRSSAAPSYQFRSLGLRVALTSSK